MNYSNFLINVEDERCEDLFQHGSKEMKLSWVLFYSVSNSKYAPWTDQNSELKKHNYIIET